MVLQVTMKLPTKVQVKWPFGSGEEAKNSFSWWSPWRPSWISDRNGLATFDLQVTLILPTKFQVNWPFGSGEAKNTCRFSRWPPWWPSWISDWNNFSYMYFCFKSHPDASYQVSSQLAFRFRRRSEKQMLPTKFLVNWPFGSGEEAKKKIFKMAAILDFQSEWY